MSKLRFIFKKLAHMDYRNIYRMAKRSRERCGKPMIFLIADILYCGAKYQASPTDYFQDEMYKLSTEQRNDLITSGVNNGYVLKYNDAELRTIFENKDWFYENFSEFLNRDWIVVNGEEDRDRFLDFIKGRDYVILKPAREGGGGRGIRKVEAAPESFDETLQELPCMVEEVIVQADELNKLNSTSVNTIRPFTFVKSDGTPVILSCYLRIGNGGLVDNFCSGGMLAPVNPDTGIIEYPAADENDETYYVHPISGTDIVGFKIPYFDEVKEMIFKACLKFPTIRYVGWDIAVTKDGPLMIEGNVYPGHVFLNFSQHHPDGVYLRHKFEKIMES